MEQLAFAFDAPLAPPPAPKREKPRKKSAWEIEREQLAEERRAVRAELPDDDERLFGRFVTNLAGYDQAVRDGDLDAQRSIANRMSAIAEHLYGAGLDELDGDRRNGNGRFYCLSSACDWLAERAAQKDGCEPLFGQKGRLLLEIAGCRVDFKYDGLFGICGGSAHVVDLDKPFFSETGYHSFQVCPYDHLIVSRGVTPAQWLVRVCEGQLTEGGKKKIKLHEPPFGPGYYGQPRTDKHLRERRATDPAYLPGGYLHGVAA